MDKICLIEGFPSNLGPPEPRNGAWIRRYKEIHDSASTSILFIPLEGIMDYT